MTYDNFEQLKGKSYIELDQMVDELFGHANFSAALELLGLMKAWHPQQLHLTMVYILACYASLKDADNMAATIREAFARDLFFRLDEELFYKVIYEHPEFEALVAENESLRLKAQALSKPQLSVVRPDNYREDHPSPLFLLLHGNGEDNEFFSLYWKPEYHTTRGALVAYLQSSQVYNYGSYMWTDDLDLAVQEIQDALEQLRKDYNIDPTQIYIGGFSGGSVASLKAVLTGAVKAKGWIGLCPVDKGWISAEQVAVSPGSFRAVMMRGSVGGEKESGELPTMLQNAGISMKVIENEGIGHWFPHDLREKLMDAKAFIDESDTAG